MHGVWHIMEKGLTRHHMIKHALQTVHHLNQEYLFDIYRVHVFRIVYCINKTGEKLSNNIGNTYVFFII